MRLCLEIRPPPVDNEVSQKENRMKKQFMALALTIVGVGVPGARGIAIGDINGDERRGCSIDDQPIPGPGPEPGAGCRLLTNIRPIRIRRHAEGIS